MSAPAVSAANPALQAVSFDCWGTLLVERQWTEAHAARVSALGEAARSAGCETTRDELRRAFDAGWNLHMANWAQGVATGAPEVALAALEHLEIAPESIDLRGLISQWEQASQKSSVEAIEGAHNALDRLQRANFALGLICDTGLTPGHVILEHLERTELRGYLRSCVFSDEIGVPKPHPTPFQAMLAALDVPADHAVHVGDLRRTDVAGARGVGMASIRVRGVFDDLSALPDADQVVDSIADVPDRVLAWRAEKKTDFSLAPRSTVS